MTSRGIGSLALRFTAASLLAASLVNSAPAQLSDLEQLGKDIFFDETLSLNNNQSCASCHGPEAGFTGPLSAINAAGAVYEGSIAGEFGARKPPSAAYATVSPVFHFTQQGGGLYVGGNFWDGRATGEKLGNPAADQAQGPFLNPVEQALPSAACVVKRVCDGPYGDDFQTVWGAGVCSIAWPGDIETECAGPNGVVSLDMANEELMRTAFDNIALSIAAYEDSAEVNAFSSKYDAFLAKIVQLSPLERKGLSLFKGKGKCSRCHTLSGNSRNPPLLTDFTYDNLGVPKNPANPVYDADPAFVDRGLGGFLGDDDYDGMQKVPTLRNVAKQPNDGFVKAFTHNGYFKTLKGVVHFYNTRDTKPVCGNPVASEAEALAEGCWPSPEVAENVNDSELGNLGLTDAEEDALVEFMKTLTDLP